jgi:hypothetical protein
MTIGASTTLRNSQIGCLTTAAANGALLHIYSGPRPATGAAITSQTLLAQLTCGSPFAAAPSGGAITMGGVTPAAAVATGGAVWARLTDSSGNFILDMDVAVSGSDLNLNSTAIQSGAEVSVTSGQFMIGNS